MATPVNRRSSSSSASQLRSPSRHGHSAGEAEQPEKRQKKRLESRAKKLVKKAHYKLLDPQQLQDSLKEAAKIKRQAAGIYAQVTAAEAAMQASLDSLQETPAQKARPSKRPVEAKSGLQEVPKAMFARRAVSTPPGSPKLR